LSVEEQEAVYGMRKALNGMRADDAVETILNLFANTKTNSEVLAQIKKQKLFG